MAKLKTALYLIFSFNIFKFSLGQNDTSCEAVNGVYNPIEWPSTTSYESTISNPPCLNEDREFVYRECSNGVWSSEPNCSHVQMADIPKCPSSFQMFSQGNVICYKLIPNTVFPPECPYENVLPFDAYRSFVLEQPIWVPVKRDRSNGLGFLQWIEPTALYRQDFPESIYISGDLTVSNKDCLVHHNNSYWLVSCDEQYTGVCAYSTLDSMRYDLCPSQDLCRASDFSPKSQCFCVGNSNSNHSLPLAEFQHSYQNNVYDSLTTDKCTFGLQKLSKGVYAWASSGQTLTYTYWSKDVVFNDENIYGAVINSAWVLEDSILPYCFLYQIDIERVQAELCLTFDEDSDKFHLLVYNPRGLMRINNSDIDDQLHKPLIYCFTDAGAWSLLYRYPSLSEIETNDTFIKYEFDFHSFGPGNYWCESFTYPQLNLITSDVIFHKDQIFGLEFIAIIETTYVKGINPLSVDIIQYMERVFSLKISNVSDLSYYTTRIMKIESLNETLNRGVFNVHLTGKNNVPDEEVDTEYANVKSLLELHLTSIPLFHVSVLHVLTPDYCAMDVLEGITWPKSNANTSTFSKEYCFFKNKTRAIRWCLGDFISGARWLSIDSCTKVSTSPITSKLEKLLSSANSSDVAWSELTQILSQFQDDSFEIVDIYLLVEIFNRLKLYNLGKEFGEVINILLDFDEGVLRGAQIRTNATDRILEMLATTYNLETINTTNFIMGLSNSLDDNGILLLEENNSLIFRNFDNIPTIETIAQTPNLKCAIWLNTFSRSTLMFFKTDAFFQSDSSYVGEIKHIFGVSFPENISVEVVTTMIHRVPNISTVEASCIFWNFSAKEGSSQWTDLGSAEQYLDFFVCKFSNPGYYALSTPPQEVISPGNVTDDLLEVLKSNSSSMNIIDALVNISSRYNDFNYIDVSLVGKILEKISNDENVDLEALATIVNNVHEVERAILSTSQQQKHATDSILYAVDCILKKHKYESLTNITTNNFFVLIADLKETNISGVALLNSNNSYEIVLLQGDVTVNDLYNYTDLESGLVISPQLKEQLGEDAKLILTIFANDSLFNEEETKNSQYVSKVFGVILPEIGNYSGPISMVHNVVKGYQEQCVHWLYDRRNNVVGSWTKDRDGAELSVLTHCEFWHTTHFALLLLDHDKFTDDLDILDWITTINCLLSLLGTSCIVLTAICFKRWRMNTGNQVLLNFVLAIVLEIGVFYTSNIIRSFVDDDLVCTIIGATLHYCIVSQFCWMFIIAILQFKRFVEVLGGPPKYIMVKACVCGWILPCLPVVCVLSLDHDNYVGGNAGLCYPSGLGLYLGVWLPIAIIVSINFVIFLFIIYSVVHRKTECADVGNNEVMFQWRLAILLFFMLGLTWTFGFLSELDWGVIFVYLFCFTATLQGFIMFLFFIVFNANTRYLYTKAFKRYCHKKDY